jgi:hypothetical protein
MTLWHVITFAVLKHGLMRGMLMASPMNGLTSQLFSESIDLGTD